MPDSLGTPVKPKGYLVDVADPNFFRVGNKDVLNLLLKCEGIDINLQVRLIQTKEQSTFVSRALHCTQFEIFDPC